MAVSIADFTLDDISIPINAGYFTIDNFAFPAAPLPVRSFDWSGRATAGGDWTGRSTADADWSGRSPDATAFTWTGQN